MEYLLDPLTADFSYPHDDPALSDAEADLVAYYGEDIPALPDIYAVVHHSLGCGCEPELASRWLRDLVAEIPAEDMYDVVAGLMPLMGAAHDMLPASQARDDVSGVLAREGWYR